MLEVRRMNRIFASVVLAAAALSVVQAHAEPTSLIIHEWGTFTSFQDDLGLTVSGINVDDEPVPKFVHRLSDVPIFTARSSPASWSQGAPRCHADVTLRLETPVLYFYPQSGFARDRPFEVRATFVGGWLTEFFPSAGAENAGFPRALGRSTRSSIQWTGLRLSPNPAIEPPATTERVWLAPRKVHSAVVVNGDEKEAEKYLFYRGVGHLDAPIVVRARDGTLTISLRDGKSYLQGLPPMWVAHVLADGRLAYRGIHAGKQRTVTAPLPIASETAPSELVALRRELKAALTAEGLYEDEADAMLETWRLSYFQSEGMRVLFVLPRPWTEAQLPLWISVPADITRVMLGRVELISPHQRAALRSLYELPASAFDLTPLYYESETVLKRLREGSKSHAELYRMLGREVPEALRLYDSLGRFRDALLAHEWRSTSDEQLRARLGLVVTKFSSCVPELAHDDGGPTAAVEWQVARDLDAASPSFDSDC